MRERTQFSSVEKQQNCLFVQMHETTYCLLALLTSPGPSPTIFLQNVIYTAIMADNYCILAKGNSTFHKMYVDHCGPSFCHLLWAFFQGRTSPFVSKSHYFVFARGNKPKAVCKITVCVARQTDKSPKPHNLPYQSLQQV